MLIGFLQTLKFGSKILPGVSHTHTTYAPERIVNQISEYAMTETNITLVFPAHSETYPRFEKALEILKEKFPNHTFKIQPIHGIEDFKIGLGPNVSPNFDC
jgi:hypothetical protein